MSPERIRGERYSFDSDIWSVGLTLVEVRHRALPLPAAGKQLHAQHGPAMPASSSSSGRGTAGCGKDSLSHRAIAGCKR